MAALSYATSTFPIVHLIYPPKFGIRIVFIIPGRNEKHRFCQNGFFFWAGGGGGGGKGGLGGGGGGVNKVHYGKCGSGTLFWNTGMGAVASSENALH